MDIVDHKISVRERVWTELRKVAVPDSRFHFDFGEFIADFQGGEAAVQRLVDHPYYRDSSYIFHHAGQLPRPPSPARASGRQDRADDDLFHTSAASGCSIRRKSTRSFISMPPRWTAWNMWANR